VDLISCARVWAGMRLLPSRRLSLRPARAQAAHTEIDRLQKASDLGDVLDVRANLRDMLGKGGPDEAAAGIALQELDRQIAAINPGIMPTIRQADAKGAQTVERAIDLAERAAARVQRRRGCNRNSARPITSPYTRGTSDRS
jgi:hypothetical protein